MGKQKKKNDADCERERERATEKILSMVDNLPFDATQECLLHIMLYNSIFHLIQKKNFVEQMSEEQKKALGAQFFFHLTSADQMSYNISKYGLNPKTKSQIRKNKGTQSKQRKTK